MKLRHLPESIGELGELDTPAGWLADQVGRVVRPGALKDLLSGTWLGHAVHPMLTDLPIGFWTSAMVLDLVGGRDTDKAADLMVGLGIAAAVPTAATGLSDYADTFGEERRVGLAHAAANTAALALYGASLLARRRGHRAVGVLLGLAGASAATVGGYLGGHLIAALGLGVDNTVFDHPAEEWTSVLAEADLQEGKPVAVDVHGARVMLVRFDGVTHAIADRCNHRGGPLHEGEVAPAGRAAARPGGGDPGCVTCPWHASRFRLDDGEVLRGPAVLPQPAYETRVHDGRIEVRPR